MKNVTHYRGEVGGPCAGGPLAGACYPTNIASPYARTKHRHSDLDVINDPLTTSCAPRSHLHCRYRNGTPSGRKLQGRKTLALETTEFNTLRAGA